VRQRFEKCVAEDSEYAHWIGLYLSIHMNWVLGPFVHGRLQNLQTNEVTFAHVVTPLKLNDLYCKIHNFLSLYSFTEGLREGMFVSQTTWFTVKFDVAKRIVLT